MSRKKSGGISWIKKEEPKFIRQFKERIAYKEQANTNTKKKALDNDLLIEREEDRPQVVQLKSGDLGEKEYLELKSKEDIANAASSFGKILFKRPSKKQAETATTEEASTSEAAKKTELDLIFNLDNEGKEIEKTEEEKEGGTDETAPVVKKKILLDDEEEPGKKYGLQEPPAKKRFIDNQKSKVETHSAKRVLERESKSGNKKLLSFYDEEEEEIEEYNREVFQKKQQEQEEEEEEDD